MKIGQGLLLFVLTLGQLASGLEHKPTKHITHFTAQLVTFETTLPVTQVLSRLDTQLNKTGSGLAVLSSIIQKAKTKDELALAINQIVGNNDFLYFTEINHHKYLNIYNGINSTPIAAVYTLGNPLIAQTILQHDLRTGLNIPPRVLVLENEGHLGTKVQYDLPSSVIVSNGNPKLKEAVAALDVKLENLVTNITSV